MRLRLSPLEPALQCSTVHGNLVVSHLPRSVLLEAFVAWLPVQFLMFISSLHTFPAPYQPITLLIQEACPVLSRLFGCNAFLRLPSTFFPTCTGRSHHHSANVHSLHTWILSWHSFPFSWWRICSCTSSLFAAQVLHHSSEQTPSPGDTFSTTHPVTDCHSRGKRRHKPLIQELSTHSTVFPDQRVVILSTPLNRYF